MLWNRLIGTGVTVLRVHGAAPSYRTPPILMYRDHHSTTMEDKHEVTVPMPGVMHEDIIENLEYGDSKAGWIREAIQMRLDAEDDEADEGNPSPAPATA